MNIKWLLQSTSVDPRILYTVPSPWECRIDIPHSSIVFPFIHSSPLSLNPIIESPYRALLMPALFMGVHRKFSRGAKLRKNLSDLFMRNRSENMFNLLHFCMFSTFLSTYHTYYHKNMLSHKFWRGQRKHFSNFSTQILWIHTSSVQRFACRPTRASHGHPREHRMYRCVARTG